MMRNYYIIFFLFMLGCKSSTEKKKVKEFETVAVKQTATQKMADRLQSINANFNPETNSFINSARVSFFKNKLDAAKDQNSKFQLAYIYCNELINAGRTQEGIAAIEELIRATGSNEQNMSEETKPLFDLRAIAYMRLGEQENCIMNHNGFSCILPLQKDAVHQLRNGSTKAAEAYRNILEKFPNDFSSQWLLNLAYMTLGEYPQSVPPKWRLPEKAFASKKIIPRFENIATSLGIDNNSHAGGCCVEDFNSDGYLDIMTSSWLLTDQMHFFVNNGDGSFTDKTSEAGLIGLTGGLNMIHADYNNDGYPDVLVLRGAWMKQAGNQPNSLLKNNGDGTFEDVTVAAGVYSEHPTQTGGWADFNLDGYLDLFIGNESDAKYTNPCELYVNNGNGTFTEVAKKLGLDLIAFVKGCDWGDVNRDGLADLYLSLFGGENKLYINRGGTNINDWKFEEVGAKAGVQQPIWSFPTWFFDYDNDGYEDIFVCGYEFKRFYDVAEDEVISIKGLKPVAETPRLYHNNGNETFTDVTKQAGVSRVMYGMGSNFGDINNDGYLDFYIGTGVPDFRAIVPNRMFLNQKGKSFVDVTYDGGFGHIQKGHAIGFGDLDNDGDNDIYTVIGGAYEGDNFRNALFNNPGNNNHWVVLKLEGKTANRSAIGAVIHITVSENGKERNIYRTVSTGGSFGSSTLQLEIGLGNASVIKLLEVEWPNKERLIQKFKNIDSNKKYFLFESRELSSVDYKAFQWKLQELHHHHHHM